VSAPGAQGPAVSAPRQRRSARRWPRSLFGRVALILFCGLAAAHLLSFGLVLGERSQAAMATMIAYLARDFASSVAVLERVPAAERPAWLGRIERRNYRYLLGPLPEGAPDESRLGRALLAAVTEVLGPDYKVTATLAPGTALLRRLHLRLSDGTPLALEISPPRMMVSPWVIVVLCGQLALLGLFTWLAVRLATRPLAQLAQAADALGPELRGQPLPEDGPSEVARAAAAFNAMQRRIADHLDERMRILAAVSHDLQTPITRMRLRADLLDNAALRDKLHGDLNAMQELVEEGIDYARSAGGAVEAARAIDLYALLDSLVCDYRDAGQPVRFDGMLDRPITTRPLALRRIVTNLVDNALKFAGDAELRVEAEAPDRVCIAVRDRGPGIAQAELQAVLQPFYRIESSRNRGTGGAGLGLAIAQQLAGALGGTLALSNREGGGLEARLSLPASG